MDHRIQALCASGCHGSQDTLLDTVDKLAVNYVDR